MSKGGKTTAVAVPTGTKIVKINEPASKRTGGAKNFLSDMPRVSLGIVAGMLPVTMSTINEVRWNGAEKGGYHFIKKMTGIDIVGKSWRFREMWDGALPVLAGVGLHKAANKLGINRAIRAAGIPIIQI